MGGSPVLRAKSPGGTKSPALTADELCGDRRFGKDAAKAAVGLVDGDVKDGRIRMFSPKSPDVILEVAAGPGATRRIVLPAEKVAYIGFCGERLEGAHILAPDPTPLRIHVAGGTQFAVEIAKSVIDHPIGYYGLPVEEDPCEFREIFFYAHGVNARERHEPIGELLVFEGMASDADIAEGLNLQSRNRSTKLGEILVEQETIDIEVVEAAAVLQKRKRMRIGEVLVEAGLATDEDIQSALAAQKSVRASGLVRFSSTWASSPRPRWPRPWPTSFT